MVQKCIFLILWFIVNDSLGVHPTSNAFQAITLTHVSVLLESTKTNSAVT